MYITRTYLYTYYSYFIYNNIYNNLSIIHMYKVSRLTIHAGYEVQNRQQGSFWQYEPK
jgi:hypothetical protein